MTDELTLPSNKPTACFASPFVPIFVFCLLVLGYQARDALITPQFWAEDGTVFFQEQVGRTLPMLFKPYAGYLHFVPRLVTWIASAWAYTVQPAVMNVVAWLIAAWALAFTTVRLGRHVPVLLTLTIIAFAPTSGEVNGTITNAQWFLQFALLAIVLVPAARPMNPWLAFAATLAMALTGPFSVAIGLMLIGMAFATAMLPRQIATIFSGQLVAWLRQLDRAAIAGLFLGALAQGLCMAIVPEKTGLPHGAYLPALHDLMGVVLPTHLFGEPLLPAKAWLLIYIAIGAMVVTGRGVTFEAKLCLLAFATIGIGMALAGLVRLPKPYDLRFDFSDRYYMLARFAFWWMLYMAFAAYWGDRPQATGATALLVVFIGCMTPQLHRRWVMAPLPWKAQARELATPGHHSIPINPAPFAIEIETDASGKPRGLPRSN